MLNLRLSHSHGSWLLGTSEGDQSDNPEMYRQYVLRSVEQGASWMVLLEVCVQLYRIYEGQPINLDHSHVPMLFRTCEGHLWASWSEDDARNWCEPQATQLFHPDASPMQPTLGLAAVVAEGTIDAHHQIVVDIQERVRTPVGAGKPANRYPMSSANVIISSCQNSVMSPFH